MVTARFHEPSLISRLATSHKSSTMVYSQPSYPDSCNTQHECSQQQPAHLHWYAISPILISGKDSSVFDVRHFQCLICERFDVRSAVSMFDSWTIWCSAGEPMMFYVQCHAIQCHAFDIWCDCDVSSMFGNFHVDVCADDIWCSKPIHSMFGIKYKMHGWPDTDLHIIGTPVALLPNIKLFAHRTSKLPNIEDAYCNGIKYRMHDISDTDLLTVIAK